MLTAVGETRLTQGRLLGLLEALGFQEEVRVEAESLVQEALKTSEIEGERLSREQLRAPDDPGLVLRREPHRLRLVELRVLEGSQPQETVHRPAREELPVDVDEVEQEAKTLNGRQFYFLSSG